jgi:hypothetical protein
MRGPLLPTPPPLPQKKRFPVDRRQIEAVMAADTDAAVEVLQAVYSYIHSQAYE